MLSFTAATAGFFVLCFLYVWVRLEPQVHWSAACPVFFLSGDFFAAYPAYLGGLLDYAAAWLAQLSVWGWLGAAVITGQAVLVFVLADWVLGSLLAARRWPVAAFGPCFLLVGIYERYPNQTLGLGLGLVTALGMALVCGLGPWAGSGQRLAIALALGAVTGYVAGLWPFVLFLALRGSIEIWHYRRLVCGIGCLTSAALAPALLLVLGKTGALEPWERGFPLLVPVAVFGSVPTLALVMAVLSRRRPTGKEERKVAGEIRSGGKRGPRSGQRPPGAGMSRDWRSVVAGGLFLAVGWACVWGAFDDSRHSLARIEHYAARREYDRLLRAAARLPNIPTDAAVRVHWALYHTGRFAEDLFSYPNQTSWNLLPGMELGLEPCRAQCETLLELGEVNEAEHLAHEALESEGDRPELLRYLAQINILEDRPDAARIFLNLLGEVPFQSAWATSRLAKLAENPRLTGDEELARIRLQMVTSDVPHDLIPTDTLLRQLLSCNPRNRMAFEYLVVHYLLRLEVGKVTEELGSFSALGYLALPRHVEEAILAQERRTGTKIDLHGYQIRAETVARFQQFCEAIGRRAQDTPEGRAALSRDFGDTYWAYYYTRPQPPGP